MLSTDICQELCLSQQILTACFDSFSLPVRERETETQKASGGIRNKSRQYNFTAHASARSPQEHWLK